MKVTLLIKLVYPEYPSKAHLGNHASPVCGLYLYIMIVGSDDDLTRIPAYALAYL